MNGLVGKQRPWPDRRLISRAAEAEWRESRAETKQQQLRMFYRTVNYSPKPNVYYCRILISILVKYFINCNFVVLVDPQLYL